MKYAKSEILASVRTVIDQNQVESEIDGLGLDHDTLELDDIIAQQTETAGKYILMNCPLRMISADGVKNLPKTTPFEVIPPEDRPLKSPSVVDGVPITANAKGKATIKLPDDYLRMTLAEMSDWDVPIRIPSLDTSEIRRIVNSAWKGVKPNKWRPCVIESQEDGVPVLNLYGSAEGQTIKQAQYVPIPQWDSDNKISIPSMTYDAVVYYTAALTMQTLGSPAFGNLIGMAMNLAGIQQQQEQKK